MKKELTVSTATFNALDYTKNFVDSLYSSTNIPFDLVIVDNNSTDGTVEFLKQLEQKDNITVIYNKENKGYGASHNQSVKLSDTDYFVVINNDVLLPNNFLEYALNTIKEFPEYKQLCARETKNTLPPPQDLNEIPKITDVKAFRNFVSGSFFIMSSLIISELDELFDERFKIGFCEDVDLSWRVNLLGYKSGFIENLKFQHYSNTTFDKNQKELPTKQEIYLSNLAKLLDKWNKEIKQYILNEMNSGVEFKDIVLNSKPFSETNSYINADKKAFMKDLLECLNTDGALLTDLNRKYRGARG